MSSAFRLSWVPNTYLAFCVCVCARASTLFLFIGRLWQCLKNVLTLQNSSWAAFWSLHMERGRVRTSCCFLTVGIGASLKENLPWEAAESNVSDVQRYQIIPHHL